MLELGLGASLRPGPRPNHGAREGIANERSADSRLGDRILRGVVPAAEAQACVYELNDCTDIPSLSESEWYGCCTKSCHQRKCTLEYHGTILGCR